MKYITCNNKGDLAKSRKQREETHQVEAEAENYIVEHLLHIAGKENRLKYMYELTVEKSLMLFEIDTISPVTVVSVEDANKHFGKMTLQKTDKNTIKSFFIFLFFSFY